MTAEKPITPRIVTPEITVNILRQLGTKGFKVVNVKFGDPINESGIGFETERDGDWLRSAVAMTDNPSLAEISEAFELLLVAYHHPEDPSVIVVRGDSLLTGNEMTTSALAITRREKRFGSVKDYPSP